VSQKKSSAPPEEDDDWGPDVDSAIPTTRRASVGAIPGGGFPSHGARLLLDGTGTMFRVWAPMRESIEVVLYEKGDGDPKAKAPAFGLKEARRVRMSRSKDGFFVATVQGTVAGARYAYVVDGEGPYPDVASRSQPFGPHGPSEVVDLRGLRWTDNGWRGRSIEELVIYELHVGTATREGTFRALVDRLDAIAALGATAIELMPVCEFPGARNWGYDGVQWFAPAHVYGRPADLAALVDAAHARNLAVILDVVYNHLGPDGNYLRTFFPGYFTDRHTTPWGEALDFDGPESSALRTMVLENAEQWIRDFHFDGLRLDATHAIVDESEHHILSAIADCARACASERDVVIIAEDERNEAKIVRDASKGGLGLDAVWADDFHHELRRMLAGDDEGYYADYRGTTFELLKILQKGWLYEGQPSKSRGGRVRGTPVFDIAPPRLIHCLQNHDQIGNRANGDRLHHAIDLRAVRAATTLLLAMPYTPLLFMGEEIAASSPFQYFTDHEAELGKLVTEGRRNEYGAFRAFRDPATRDTIPDPQANETFLRSKIDWSEAEKSPGKEMLALHRALLSLRKKEPAMKNWRRGDMDVIQADEGVISVRRRAQKPDEAPLLYVVCLGGGGEIRFDDHDETSPRAGQSWKMVLDSEEKRFGGAGKNARLEARTLVLTGVGAVVLRG
jgi:maltooligosyltrehalose trehalohydrolase